MELRISSHAVVRLIRTVGPLCVISQCDREISFSCLDRVDSRSFSLLFARNAGKCLKDASSTNISVLQPRAIKLLLVGEKNVAVNDFGIFPA